jgi:hypothetical protein
MKQYIDWALSEYGPNVYHQIDCWDGGGNHLALAIITTSPVNRYCEITHRLGNEAQSLVIDLCECLRGIGLMIED